jgi:TIR domain/Protein of unknown function (DUF3298)
MAMSDNPLIFISYATPDRDRVLPYYDALSARGYDVWMDCRRLKAGQNWDFEIKLALDRAALIVVFVSKNSVDRRGYVQREIKIALAKAAEKLIDDIYLIPILLDDDATIPEQIKSIHIVRASDSDSSEQIEDAVRHQLERLGANVAEAQVRSSVRWSSTTYRDSWDGLPGYDSEFQLLDFSSEQYPRVSEVTDVIKGSMLLSMMDARFAKFSQDTEQYDFGQERYLRSNTWGAFAGEPKFAGRLLSIRYSVHCFHCGAAHPNSDFETYCFLLDPLVRITNLQSMFEDEAASLEVIRSFLRQRLLLPSNRGLEEEPADLEKEWVFSGTENWDSFRAFVFDEDGLEVSFAPYQVACYVAGPQFAKIPYKEFKHLLTRTYVNALQQ